MTKRNLIITIILLSFIDLVAAGWYVSQRIEASGKSQDLFNQRDSTDYVAEADTVTLASEADLFDELQHNTYYYIANSPSITGDNSSRYTSIKHVKVRWPRKVNGDSDFSNLNKELISKAFGNTQTKMQDARFVYLNKPSFNKPLGEGDYHKLSSAPTIVPVYGNVSQVLVFPYMTSQRLLVMEIDKVEYNGNTNSESRSFIHYDRMKQRVLSRLDILVTDVEKENKLLKTINSKIDDLNKGRSDDKKLQHALNVPAEICCTKKGVLFQYKHGTIFSTPVEVLIEYNKLEPFFTEEFKQLLKANDDYKVYDNHIKPEPINPITATKTAFVSKPAAATTTSAKKSSNSYYKRQHKHQYNHQYKRQYKRQYNRQYKQQNQYVKPRYKNQKRYSGAKRKSGRYGYAGKRSWSRRRR